ncbi:MAG: preprotein translocase subunit SecE [Prevotellaceae bacterium]|jgi:preprotein translocase subunit SecE|nr:preprotein translocase subunit SecE [Prevotellaceae bacterium]
MKKINAYFGEAYNELVHKVTWPSFGQLQSSAVVVMIASVIMSLVIFAMDLTFRQVMTFIYEFLY